MSEMRSRIARRLSSLSPDPQSAREFRHTRCFNQLLWSSNLSLPVSGEKRTSSSSTKMYGLSWISIVLSNRFSSANSICNFRLSSMSCSTKRYSGKFSKSGSMCQNQRGVPEYIIFLQIFKDDNELAPQPAPNHMLPVLSRRQAIMIGRKAVASPSIVTLLAPSATFPQDIPSLKRAPERLPSYSRAVVT